LEENHCRTGKKAKLMNSGEIAGYCLPLFRLTCTKTGFTAYPKHLVILTNHATEEAWIVVTFGAAPCQDTGKRFTVALDVDRGVFSDEPNVMLFKI
jgi:hypothetical protein